MSKHVDYTYQSKVSTDFDAVVYVLKEDAHSLDQLDVNVSVLPLQESCEVIQNVHLYEETIPINFVVLSEIQTANELCLLWVVPRQSAV